MVRTLRLHSEVRPELSRILAIAAAIAVHAFAFLLLLIPMASMPLDPAPAEPARDRWTLPEVVPIPPIPEELPVVQQRQPVETARQQPIPEREPVATESVIDQGTLPASAESVSSEVDAIGPATFDTSPMVGAHLEYSRAPAPPYPRDAARAGIEGTVLLKILVDVDGSPLEVAIQKSSGHHSLDRGAREQVLKHWRFKPAMRDGQAVQAYGLVPIVFSMQ